jgi:uncharacterized protein
MKNRIALKFIVLSFVIAWSCWFLLMLLVNSDMLKYGDTLFMIIYLLGGICPSFVGYLAVKSDKNVAKTLKTDTLKYKVNGLWYIGIALIPLFLSGVSWILNTLLLGKTSAFLNNNILTIIPMLPVMIIGGGSEEIGWRGVLLPIFLKDMSPIKATVIVALIWGIWHIPLWFIAGVPQYGSNFIVFMCGIFSMSILLSIVYIRTGSVLLCILFHAVENAYLNIGKDTWSQGLNSNLIIGIVGLVIPIILFTVFKVNRPKIIPT